MQVVPATKAGVTYSKGRKAKSLSADAVTGSDKTDKDILVPYAAVEEARDVCIGIGAIKPESEEVKIDEQSVEDAASSDIEEYEGMSPAKRTTVKIVSAILLIIIACLLIWGTDAVTGWIKGLF